MDSNSGTPYGGHRGRRPKREVAIVTVVVAIVVVILILTFDTHVFGNGGSPGSNYNTISVASPKGICTLNGTTYTFGGKYVTTESAQVNVSISTTQDIFLFLMTPSQYSAFVGGSNSSAYFERNSSTSINFHTSLPPGTWYFVISNFGTKTASLTFNYFTVESGGVQTFSGGFA